jgi:hypothetical protein
VEAGGEAGRFALPQVNVAGVRQLRYLAFVQAGFCYCAAGG